MIKNFEVVDAVGLSFEGNYFDLHNDFKIIDLKIDGSDFEIAFQRLVDSEEVGGVRIEFRNFNYLESDVFPLNGDCLFISEVGYKNPDDMDCDWLLSESASRVEDHLFFRFDADHFLRICAQSVEAKIV